MSDTSHSPAHRCTCTTHHTNYVKIWGILVVLLVVSRGGPAASASAGVTLVTAFGIALVKAYLVAKHFMHINLEKRWIAYLLLAMLAFMAGHRRRRLARRDAARRPRTGRTSPPRPR